MKKTITCSYAVTYVASSYKQEQKKYTSRETTDIYTNMLTNQDYNQSPHTILVTKHHVRSKEINKCIEFQWNASHIEMFTVSMECVPH